MTRLGCTFDGCCRARFFCNCLAFDFNCHVAGRIRQICATYSAFASLTATGAVIAWGDPDWGGDASKVENELRRGVVQVACLLELARPGTRGKIIGDNWYSTVASNQK